MASPVLSPDHVHRRLAEFAGFLRQRGVRIGIRAEVELGEALSLLPVLDRESVREACGAVFAKSPEELIEVKRAFNAFFSSTFSRRQAGSPRQSVAPRPVEAPSGGAGPIPPESTAGPPARETQFGMYSAQAPGAGHELGPLRPRDILSLRRGARRFRRRTATLPGRRFSRSRRGEVDFPETLRRSTGWGGEGIELSRRVPRKLRTDLVVLWDVSGSMREHDARLFGLVYALERSSRSARVFAFSTRVAEITEEIRRHGYRQAVPLVASRIARAEGGTQIGPSLRQFTDRYPTAVGDRVTVVVVSDGWDRADSAAVGAELRRIHRRGHLVVWVSPYARRPGFRPETAGLVSALPYTDLLMGPEDFLSPYPLPPIEWKKSVRSAET
jgi:uncharacterized protein with von Willebrand factor type A (vWA) domain